MEAMFIMLLLSKIMCATCGRDLREKDGRAGQRKEAATANVSMIHHVPELIVSDDLATELGSADLKNVLNSRKLVLLVDLDQTIIHTTNRPFKVDPKVHGDIHTYKMFGTEYHTKLRPYTHEFLEHMSALYEMHIITYGQRQYAHKIAEVWILCKILFAQRILSRDELFSAQHKTRNLRALFPCGDQLIAIIDDRADVWQFSEALIQVKPYRFFKEVGDINAPAGAGKDCVLPAIDIEHDAEHDRTLEHIERMLTDVHANFYQYYDKTKEIRDVKVVISYIKKQVLRGLVIVLSGVVPLGMNTELSEAYRLCVQFGATVDEKEFELTKDSKPPEDRPLGSRIIPELTSIDAMKKETIAAMEHEVDEVLSEGDDSDEEVEEKLKRRLNGGDGSGDEDDEVEKELAMKRARWEREGNFETPEEEDSVEDGDSDEEEHFCEISYEETTKDDETNGTDNGPEIPDEEETRDIQYDDEEDEEIEDMAALIERQVSHDA
ncbi:FCP1-like phosphatase, phosphatase domain protein [Cooperia oncophora]